MSFVTRPQQDPAILAALGYGPHEEGARLFVRKLFLVHADIVDLVGTVQVLVPAPPTGYANILLSTFAIADTSNGAYTSPDGGENGYADLNVCYASNYPTDAGAAFITPVGLSAPDLLAASGIQRIFSQYSSIKLATPKPNDAIYLFNDVDEWEDGAEGNTLTIYAHYLVLPAN